MLEAIRTFVLVNCSKTCDIENIEWPSLGSDGVCEGKAVDEGWESRSVAPPGGGSRYLERLHGSPVRPATLSPTRTFEGDASCLP